MKSFKIEETVIIHSGEIRSDTDKTKEAFVEWFLGEDGYWAINDVPIYPILTFYRTWESEYIVYAVPFNIERNLIRGPILRVIDDPEALPYIIKLFG